MASEVLELIFATYSAFLYRSSSLRTYSGVFWSKNFLGVNVTPNLFSYRFFFSRILSNALSKTFNLCSSLSLCSNFSSLYMDYTHSKGICSVVPAVKIFAFRDLGQN